METLNNQPAVKRRANLGVANMLVLPLNCLFSYPLSPAQLSVSVHPLSSVWPPVTVTAVPLSPKVVSCLPGKFFLPFCILDVSVLNRHGTSLPFQELLMFTWSLQELSSVHHPRVSPWLLHPRASPWLLKDNDHFPSEHFVYFLF